MGKGGSVLVGWVLDTAVADGVGRGVGRSVGRGVGRHEGGCVGELIVKVKSTFITGVLALSTYPDEVSITSK